MENMSIVTEGSVGQHWASALNSESGTQYAVLVLNFVLTHLKGNKRRHFTDLKLSPCDHDFNKLGLFTTESLSIYTEGRKQNLVIQETETLWGQTGFRRFPTLISGESCITGVNLISPSLAPR